MKPMIWHPEEKDQKVNQYLDQMNHAPYGTILVFGLGLVCVLTFFILLGVY